MSTAVRDECDRVLCPHGRPMTCLECGEEYAQELTGPASGAPAAVDERSTERATAESTGASEEDAWVRIASQNAEDANARLAAVQQQNRALRSALAGLVGASTRDELEQIEVGLRLMSAPAQDKAAMIDAVHALFATLEEPASVAAVGSGRGEQHG